MWRPDNWVEISGEAVDKLKKGGFDYTPACFGAGADAMLGALKEQGVFTYGNHTPDIALEDAKEESGYWVFIPEGNE